MAKKDKAPTELQEAVAPTAEETAKEAAILAAFTAGIDSNFDEDSIKLSMINSGASFKNVARFYNKFMIDAGLTVSKADRDVIVADQLTGLSFAEEADFDTAVSYLLATLDGSTQKSASALVRGFAKKNDLPFFVKPKAVGGDGQKNTFVHKYYDWLASKPSATEAEAHSFIFGEDGYAPTSDNVKNYEKMHQNVRALANRIAAA